MLKILVKKFNGSSLARIETFLKKKQRLVVKSLVCKDTATKCKKMQWNII